MNDEQSQVDAPETNPWAVLVGVAAGMLMAVLGIGIVNIALPTIADDMNASLPNVQWVLIAYLLSMTGLVPIFGRISDVLGRKRLFVSGILTVAGASVLAALAPAVIWLIAARAIQGVGGALIMANTYAIVTDIFPEDTRGTAMGVLVIMISGGAALGPSVGGFLATNFGWQAVFLLNVPLALIAATVAAILLPPLKSNRTREPVDIVGAVLLFGGLTPLLLGVTQVDSWGLTSTRVVSLVSGGLVLMAVFFAWERRMTYPLVDLSLFRIRPFGMGLLAAMVTTLTMGSMMLLLPFYWQGLRGFSAQDAGLLMLPLPGLLMITAPLAGRATDRWGARRIATTGLCIMFVGLASLSQISAEMPIWNVLWRVMLLGMGIGMFMAPNNNAIMSAAPEHRRGIASGLLGTFRYTGQSTGVAFSGMLFAVYATAQGFSLTELPGRERLLEVQDDPAALEAYQAAFMNGMEGVLLTALPVVATAAVLSFLRGAPPPTTVELEEFGSEARPVVAGGGNGHHDGETEEAEEEEAARQRERPGA